MPSRRSFIQQIAGVASGYSIAKAKEHADPRARLAVTSWPFRAYIESPTNRGRKATVPGMDLKDFPALIVEKFSVRNINPLGDHFRSTDPAYLDAFRAAVERAGSRVVDLGLGGKRFYDADDAVRRSAVQFGCKWIDIAVALGSPSVRQHLSGGAGEKPDAARAAASLGELAAYGAKRNIVVNLENDNAIYEDPFFLVEVIGKVNSPHLRALPDFGNSLMGHDQSYNEKAVTAMFKCAGSMCHVKDRLQSDDGKVFTVDLQRMFAIAKTSSYHGYFSMEFDTNSGDPFAGTQHLIEESLKYLT